jgi:hypothetical protein
MRCPPRRRVSPKPCEETEALWQRRVIRSEKEFQRSEFPGMGSEQQKLQTKNQTKRNDTHEHTNHLSDALATPFSRAPYLAARWM